MKLTRINGEYILTIGGTKVFCVSLYHAFEAIKFAQQRA